MLILQFGSPSSGKSRNPVVRAIISQLYQIGVQLLSGPLLFAGQAGPALDLPNGDLLPEMPTADHTE
ncbi:hypothetical protein A8V01_05560 [Novosphingobium guangzhouense]|uniref:Uncharacterized protein n=1 Tax=Novosphingobium guangzhouense TaxID=1850347 RepID=A0A2K2FZ66_9SPHN|nr:hypothetical protein A8V01_05560 [Novosphingobium guangzhouense]